MSARLLRSVPVVILLLALVLGSPRQAASQASLEAALRTAREAQRMFEIVRIGWSPQNHDGRGGSCDEVIGRLCVTDDAGADWYPGPEDPRVGRARDTLLAALARSAEVAPDDPWILGQRVVYLGEAGQWERADSLASAACARADGAGPEARSALDLPPGTWCRALKGLALHSLGRFADSELAFRSALDRMDSAQARAWTNPELDLDAIGRSWWKDLSASARADRTAFVWLVADPLLLVPGNDALTEHWARRTLARARSSSRNGTGISWGSDFEDMMMRYGAEVGWEREAPRPGETGPPGGISHRDPESRPLFPGGGVLRDPAGSGEPDWIPDLRRTRSGYAPPYAAVVLPGAGQLALFPRGERFVLVGAHALPDDTTYHAKHTHPSRNRALGPWRDMPSQAGLFLTPVEGPGATMASRSTGSDRGALLLEAPAGRWLASLEVFAPEERRAGRSRMGMMYAGSPPDVPTLSDLLLIDAALPDRATLEEAAARARPREWLGSGERLAIAWEVFGLGPSIGSLSYRLSVEKADEGAMRRLGRRLGLFRGEVNRSLEWQEPGPDRPEAILRSVEIELPRVEPGPYRVHLEVMIPGRTTLVREKTVTIR